MKSIVSAAVLPAVLLAARAAHGLQTTNYNAAVHDRFVSGFPAAPVANTNEGFVGLEFDWSGVGWLTTDPAKGMALLSPMHALVAEHWTNAPGDILRFFDRDGRLVSAVVSRDARTGYGYILSGNPHGDIAISAFTAPLPAGGTAYYSILDRSDYAGQPLWLYGRGLYTPTSPRIGPASVFFVGPTTGSNSYFVTERHVTQLEGGDSGSPAFIPWTNAAGQAQLTLLGNHAAVSADYNIINHLPRPENLAAMNTILLGDGFALRWVGEVTHDWQGGSAGQPERWAMNGNWVQNSQPGSSSYLRFDTNVATRLTVDLNGTRDARGLYFTAGGFTLTNGTLNLGKGGLVNYDAGSAPLLEAAVSLADHQYWDGGAGGFQVSGGVNLGAFRLIVEGAGTSRVDGAVIGSGGVTKAGPGIFSLAASNAYSGGTVVAGGTLRIDAASGSATGSGGVLVHTNAVLAGSGRADGIVEVRGGGILSPGFGGAGELEFGGLTLDPGAFFIVELHGAAQHDRVAVNGAVTVHDAILEIQLLYVPSLGQTFTLLANQGGQPVGGAFRDLPEAGVFQSGGAEFEITYFAGPGGHDIQVTVIPEPATVAFLVLAALVAGWRRRRAARVPGRTVAAA